MHHGDWKLIRTFHYGEDGKHDYRLYNLREDIGENKNRAADHPEKVKALDTLIEDYIAEANVVVPRPNPNFDPAKFDPSKIGVQAGGLKMPSSKKSQKKPAAAKPAPTVKKQSMLGWSARGANVSVRNGALHISPVGGQPFLANTKVQANGPVEVKLRLRARKKGTARLQWRTEDQDSFPATGQSQSFAVAGGDWQELKVPLPVEGRLVHLRLFLPAQKQPMEIDWIEITPTKGDAGESQRWDFGATTKSGTQQSEGRCPTIVKTHNA